MEEVFLKLDSSSVYQINSSDTVTLFINPILSSIKEGETIKNWCLSPNPASDEVTLTNLDFRIHRLYIVNELNQLMRTVELSGKTITLSVSDLPQGFYFIVGQDNGITRHIKFLKM